MKRYTSETNAGHAWLVAILSLAIISSVTAQDINPEVRLENANDQQNEVATSSKSDLQNNKENPVIPAGWKTAFPTVVERETKPMLTWDITYPGVVEEFVKIHLPGTISINATVDVEVRVLGNGITASTKEGDLKSLVNAAAYIRVGDGNSYEQIFYGTDDSVDPEKVVWSKKKLEAGQTLKFGGRYRLYGNWSEFVHSDRFPRNVRTFVRDQEPPFDVTGENAPNFEKFIGPYLEDGKLQMGPMDVIVFIELTHDDTQQDDPGYDLQDMVLLVRFIERK